MLKFLKSLFTPKMYVIGLPLSKQSTTKEFIDFFKEDVETICIMSASMNVSKMESSPEFKSSSSGYEVMMENGYKFISLSKLTNEKKSIVMLGDCWRKPDGTRRIANQVGEYVYEVAKELRKKHPNARIARIGPGSPYLYDGVAGYLINNCPNIEVIDTKSSAQLAYERVCSLLDCELPMNIVEPTECILEDKSVNIVGCVGFIYKDYVKLDMLVEAIKPGSKLYEVKIGYNSSIEEIKVNELMKLYEETPDYSPSIIAIIDEN